jgi:hypothetical protein
MKKLLLLIAFCPLFVWATNPVDLTQNQFENKMKAYMQNPHASTYQFQVFFSKSNRVQLPEFSTLKAPIQKLVKERSNIWGDTILEGDYFSKDQAHLDTVTALFKNKQLFAYAVTYSAKAWYTGDCAFDFKNLKTLVSCQVGRIVESIYISADLEYNFMDENKYAQFVP